MLAARVITPLASTLNGPVTIGVTLVLVVVTGTPFNVSFPVTVPGTVVATVPDGTVTVSSMASITLATVTLAVTESQLAGTTLIPVIGSASHNWYVITYVPDGVLPASVITPFASTLNGPVVNGVTLVLAAVTKTPFKVSFPVTFLVLL